MKRAIGVAALGGGLLAFSAGAASAQETSADVSARIGRSTSAQARVCSNGQALSRLLGSCGQDGSSGSDQTTGTRARVRVPRVASAGVSLEARRTRPQVTASGRATRTQRADTARADAAAGTSPRGRASATADLSGRLLTVDSLVSLAGVGLLGSSPFTLAGDPATDSLLPSALDLDLLTGSDPAPAGIGVLGSGPIASGNQVGADVGDISPTVPVTVCGNGVGVLGDAWASCGTSHQPTTTGSTGTSGGSATSPGTGTSTSGSLRDGSASGNQVDAGIGSISPTVPVTVCGNGVGVLGDASASCGTSQQPTTGSTGSTGTSDGSSGSGSTGSGNGADVTVAGASPSAPVTVCGNSAGVLGDASASCGASQDTSSDGTTAPAPVLTGRTDTTGTTGTPGQTGTFGTIGTPGQTGTTDLTPATSGGLAGSITAFAPLRPLVSAGARALPFTGAASDLLAAVAVALLMAGALILRAARPAVVREGGDR